ncbi:hypothetical protein [Pasteuria penetrans]|uniref:hypothetical protein n=1 Tax=Pasteuria penetrans TaxID=86005 RepID=UPI000FAD71E9|nr:hypothetical protein [Pasteuria penetrans]
MPRIAFHRLVRSVMWVGYIQSFLNGIERGSSWWGYTNTYLQVTFTANPALVGRRLLSREGEIRGRVCYLPNTSMPVRMLKGNHSPLTAVQEG